MRIGDHIALAYYWIFGPRPHWTPSLRDLRRRG